MSLMSKIFRGKKEKVKTPQEAMEKLANVEDLLQKKQEHLEQKIDTELATAKSYGTKNKRMALQALRRKKNYEKELDQIDGVLNTITSQKNSLENATMNADVLQVISSSSKSLKQAHKGMSVEQVEDIIDDVRMGIEMADEIQNAFAAGLCNYNSDELEQELKDLENEITEKNMLAELLPVAPTNDLPSRATFNTAAKSDAELEKALEKLANWSS